MDRFFVLQKCWKQILFKNWFLALFFLLFFLIGCGFQFKSSSQRSQVPKIFYRVDPIQNDTYVPALGEGLFVELTARLKQRNVLSTIDLVADRLVAVKVTGAGYGLSYSTTSSYGYYDVQFSVTASVTVFDKDQKNVLWPAYVLVGKHNYFQYGSAINEQEIRVGYYQALEDLADEIVFSLGT